MPLGFPVGGGGVGGIDFAGLLQALRNRGILARPQTYGRPAAIPPAAVPPASLEPANLGSPGAARMAQVGGIGPTEAPRGLQIAASSVPAQAQGIIQALLARKWNDPMTQAREGPGVAVPGAPTVQPPMGGYFPDVARGSTPVPESTDVATSEGAASAAQAAGASPSGPAAEPTGDFETWKAAMNYPDLLEKASQGQMTSLELLTEIMRRRAAGNQITSGRGDRGP